MVIDSKLEAEIPEPIQTDKSRSSWPSERSEAWEEPELWERDPMPGFHESLSAACDVLGAGQGTDI